MNELFKVIKDDKIIQRSFMISAGLIAVAVIYSLIYYRSLPPFIPLYNQLPWGEQRLANTIGVFIPSLISLLILMLNFFLSSFIYLRNPLLSRILAITSFLIAILTLLFTIRTVQIVV
ncbi:MAG: hypothetical protein M1365_01660 [Actinobacteria bacterium]|nr:hypothetical protein [Actinomycetota bacterium]